MSFRVKEPNELLGEVAATCQDSKQLVAALNASPLLRDACVQAATFVCDVVPTRNGYEPLFNHALKRGWAEYRRVGGGGSRQHQPRVRAFTCGLVSAMADVTFSRVYIRTGSSYSEWNPGPEMLYNWLQARKGHRPVVSLERMVELSDIDAIELAAARILPWLHIAALGGMRSLVDEASEILERV